MKINIFLIALFFLSINAAAQEENLEYIDKNYLENIKSVKIHSNKSILSPPIVNLNTGELIVCTFDDLDADIKSYTYSIVHCNANWEPSDIESSVYIKGFDEEDLETYEFSSATLQPALSTDLNVIYAKLVPIGKTGSHAVAWLNSETLDGLLGLLTL